MDTIKKQFEKFLEDDNNKLCNPGGVFKAKDFKLIMGILDETLDNFIVFDNRGGRPFHVWEIKPNDMKQTIDHMSSYIYMYKHDGIETIVSNLPIY